MDFRQHSPPPSALKFFRWYCRADRREELEGDLEESYYLSLSAGKSARRANILFWWNVLRCCRSYAYKSTVLNRYSNSAYPMLTNYLKVIRKNFAKQRVYALLNIAGLAIGFTACVLISIYLHFETSFEDFHSKADNIHRVTVHYTSPSGYDTHFARVDMDYINAVPSEIPEVEKLIRFQNHEPKFLRIGEEKFLQDNAFVTDKDVFEVFDFPLTQGDPAVALVAPFSVVISEKVAKKYFGDANPMGKEVFITGWWSTEETTYKITGVMEDLPVNTHLPVDMLFSFRNEAERSWWAYTYLLLKDGASAQEVRAKIDLLAVKNDGEKVLEGTEFVLQPLKSIHLQSNLAREIKPNGSIAYVKIFLVVGILILALAMINFMNLSSAMSLARSKEIGIRKILGAAHWQVVLYSLTESVIFCLLAALASAGLAYLVFPLFSDITEIENLLSLVQLTVGLLAIAVVSGLLGGFYPAFVISSFKPSHIIKSGKVFSLTNRAGKFNVKRMFITLQFAISILLIGSALIARRQFVFLNETNLGIEKDQVIALTSVPDVVKDQFKLFKDKLESQPGIKGVSACLEVPSREIRDGGVVMAEGIQEVRENAPSMDIQVIDHDFLEVMGIELLAGEPLPKSLVYEPLPTFAGGDDVGKYLLEKRRAYLINETAMHKIGWKTPEEALGKNIEWTQDGGYRLARGPVVGIVKDYHQETLKNKVDPMIMVFEPLWLRNFLVKAEPDNIEATLATIESTWNELFPQYPFEYHFLDELFNNLYQNEQRQLKLLYMLSGLAIVIAFIGLFGLIAYSLRTRVKEIAIRKVMGAGFGNLVRLIGKEYLAVMTVGAVLAIPPSYFLVSAWLDDFAYRVEVTPLSYIVTLSFIALLLLATVALQTLKSASANPAETLREE